MKIGKIKFDDFPASVELAVLKNENKELKKEKEKLEKEVEIYKNLATVDPLTGLRNRREFEEFLERVENIFSGSGHYKRDKTGFYILKASLAILDIDDFKKINDNSGHLEGDRLLTDVASVLKYQIRCSDASFRIGGDEFAVIFFGIDEMQAFHQARRLMNEMPYVSLSVGISRYYKGDTPQQFFQKADDALYAVKNNGKSGICLYSQIK